MILLQEKREGMIGEEALFKNKTTSILFAVLILL